MTGAQWLYLLGSVLTLVGAYTTAKLGAKANAAKVLADKEVGAGQLALNIANRLDAELLALRRRVAITDRWWVVHDEWDDAVLRELERLDPGARERIGPPPKLPIPVDENAGDMRREYGEQQTRDHQRGDERSEKRANDRIRNIDERRRRYADE